MEIDTKYINNRVAIRPTNAYAPDTKTLTTMINCNSLMYTSFYSHKNGRYVYTPSCTLKNILSYRDVVLGTCTCIRMKL